MNEEYFQLQISLLKQGTENKQTEAFLCKEEKNIQQRTLFGPLTTTF
jgi:hypothetical protein